MAGIPQAALGGSFFDKNVPKMVLKSLFCKYDKDGSGQLNREELKGLFVDDLGLTKDQAESYAYLLDKDGNGRVSFEEFHQWLQSGERFKNVNDKSRYNRLRKAVELFKSYDKDGSGALDREEFEKLFLAFGGIALLLFDFLAMFLTYIVFIRLQIFLSSSLIFIISIMIIIRKIIMIIIIILITVINILIIIIIIFRIKINISIFVINNNSNNNHHHYHHHHYHNHHYNHHHHLINCQ